MKTIVQIENLNAEDLINRLEKIESHLSRVNLNDTPAEKDEFLTRSQVSEILKVSRQTLSVWHKKGVLVGSRIGTRIRYRYTDVEKLINESGK
jgi:excisionase family DNA binding protein